MWLGLGCFRFFSVRAKAAMIPPEPTTIAGQPLDVSSASALGDMVELCPVPFVDGVDDEPAHGVLAMAQLFPLCDSNVASV